MATIKDVAQLANVSIATVSNYLNKTKPVSKPVATKIKESIDILQYSQNLSAKSLKTNSYNDVGIIIPNFNDSYYVQIFQGIEHAFSNNNYFLNLAFTYDIPELEHNIVKNMLKKQICGLILVSCQPDDWKFYYENFLNHDRPIVMIDRLIKGLDANYVSFDNYAVIRQMTTHLLEMNYKKIYLMTGPSEFECEESCIRGFVDAHIEAGKLLDTNALIQTELNKEDAFRKITILLKNDLPEIIIATSESTTTGIIEGLHLLGHNTKNIPVITLGEEHWNKYTHSFATFSTARPAIKMGGTAAKLLIEQLKSPQVRETEKIILHDNVLNSSISYANLLSKTQENNKDSNKASDIRILMLDTSIVNSFRGLLKNFEDQTGIKVNVTILPHHNLIDEILRSHEEQDPNKQYDIYMYDIPWLPSLASQGILEDITENLQTIDTSIFFPDCLQHFSAFQNKYYGIPFMYAPQILYYRKDLFDNPILCAEYERSFGSSLRPPLTLKEFNAIAEFFTSKTDAISYGISVSAVYDECLAPEIYMRLRAYGSRLFDKNGKVIFDNPQTLKAYINFKQAIRFAKPNYLSATDVSTVNDFLQGETAMLISYPAFLTDVTDLRKSSMIGSIGYSLIPGRAPLLGGWSLGINKQSTKKDEALELIKWTCDKQIGNYFALLGGQSAITSTYTNDELVKLYPWLPLYYSAYQYTKPTATPKLQNNQIIASDRIDAIVCKWVYKMMADEIDVQNAIFNTHKELEEMVKNYHEAY
jgi:multiple sugar transport system substrate-binding protein